MVKLLYVLKQETSRAVWTSSEVFEAKDVTDIKRAVRAGWLKGEARWAEYPDGRFVYGIDAAGKERTV